MKKYVDEATGIFLVTFLWFIFIFWGILKKDIRLFTIILTSGGILVFIYFLLLKYKSTARIVENNREEETKYLDEKGNLKVLPPGQTITGVDGINTCILPGKVFKVHNGVNVKITRKGEVKEVNFLSKLYNRSGGGWVSKEFFNEYELQNEWEQLFNC
jgi:hypothetical protein